MNRWDVMTRRTKKDGGVYWHKVGAAFEGDKGINITLDSLPLPNAEGQCWLSLFEPREREAGTGGGGRGNTPRGTNALDDDVPFLRSDDMPGRRVI